MAKKKSAPQETKGVLIKAATTIGRAAGKIAALVTSKASKQEGRAKAKKSRTTKKVKPSSRKKTAATIAGPAKARKTKRRPKV